jgi:hypothetical protein
MLIHYIQKLVNVSWGKKVYSPDRGRVLSSRVKISPLIARAEKVSGEPFP